MHLRFPLPASIPSPLGNTWARYIPSPNEVLLGEIREYGIGPKTEVESKFEERFKDANWNARSWNLLPRHDFCGPTPGAKNDCGRNMLNPLQCFFTLWNDKIQQRLVRESNNYVVWTDLVTGEMKGGPQIQKKITRHEFRQFTGIYAFMAIWE